jgi:threonine/homoserine/homoserine lactone efflux protein
VGSSRGWTVFCYLGTRTLASQPAASPSPSSGRGPATARGSTLALPLSNPSTILSFAAVFAGVGEADAPGDHQTAALLVLSMFLGSALWWLLLSGAVDLVRASFTTERLGWVNRLSRATLVAFGLLALATLLR